MSQETIRKLAERIIKHVQFSGLGGTETAKGKAIAELAPFGALLEIAELRTDCLNKPMRTGCNCYGCRTRAALADIQKG